MNRLFGEVFRTFRGGSVSTDDTHLCARLCTLQDPCYLNRQDVLLQTYLRVQLIALNIYSGRHQSALQSSCEKSESSETKTGTVNHQRRSNVETAALIQFLRILL